ncbi:hypothetical protein [Moorena producens]|nr:hypothetical protein [Moorena producens]
MCSKLLPLASCLLPLGVALYHCPSDAELNKYISSAPIYSLPNVITED